MNIQKLKGKLVEKGVSVEKLADEVGVDRSTMYRKFQNLEKVTIGEALKIKSFLCLSDDDATDIFLRQ